MTPKKLTEKQKYIAAFLYGYFVDKFLNYGFTYFNELEKAEKLAKNLEKQIRYDSGRMVIS